MKKFIKSLILLIVISGFAGIIYLFFLSPDEKFQSIYLVPNDAAYIVESEDPFGAWNKIIHSNAWNYLKTNELLADLNKDILSADSMISSNRLLIKLFGSRKILISSHRYKQGMYEFLFVVDLKKASKLKNVKNYLNKVIDDNYTLTVREFKGYEIFELFDKDSRDLYYFSQIKNQLIFSSVYSLIEASVNQLDKLTLGRDLNYIDVTRYTSGKGLFSICINYPYFKDYLTGIMGKPNDFVNRMAEYLYYTSASFSLDESGMIKISGYTSIKDTATSFFKAMTTSGQGAHSITNIAPSRTATFINLGCDNVMKLYQNINSSLDAATRRNMESTILKTEKKLKINVTENLLSWMDDEIALLQTQPSNLGRQNEFAVVFKAKSDKLARENLNILTVQVRKNSPVKIREVAYKGYTINYLHIPGIFKALFGKLISRLEKPYYAIIDRYVIFSNHPQTLKSIIDDFEAGKTLEQTENSRQFMKNFPGKSMAFVYLQTPVLFSNLKEFVSVQSWSDLQKNKKYFISFPNIGLHTENYRGLLKLDLMAEFNPQYEEFTPVNYFFDPISTLFEDSTGQSPDVELQQYDFEPVVLINDLDASKYEERFENGKLRLTVDLKNGLKHGNFREFYENGKLRLRGKFKQDMMDGTWKLYDENGNLLETREYSDGKF